MNENPYRPPENQPARLPKRSSLNPFDKFCAVFALIFGVIFLLLGVIGLVFGCSAQFTLPPVLGAFPAFIGWGITRSVYFAWKRPNQPADVYSGPEPIRSPGS